MKNISKIILISLSIITFSCSNSSENSTSSFGIEYKNQVKNSIQNLSKEDKNERDSTILKLKSTSIYNELVINKTLSQKYLPLLTGIGMLISTKNDEGCSMTKYVQNVIQQNKGYDEFVRYNIIIAMRGGLTPDMVDLFYRYKEKYGFFGDSSKIVYDINGKEEKIENPYSLVMGLCVFEPKKQEFLEALFESVDQNYYSWIDGKNDRNYTYHFLLFKNSFEQHLNKNAPKSKYNFLKYKSFNTPVSAGYFEVVANGVRIDNKIDLGNEHLNQYATNGNLFLIVNATYKNIDTEGRTLLSAGSIFIEFNEKEYEFDKTETILSENYGVAFEGLNPLTKKNTNLVFSISNEIKGHAFWIPSGSSEKIYLGKIQ